MKVGTAIIPILINMNMHSKRLISYRKFGFIGEAGFANGCQVRCNKGLALSKPVFYNIQTCILRGFILTISPLYP